MKIKSVLHRDSLVDYVEFDREDEARAAALQNKLTAFQADNKFIVVGKPHSYRFAADADTVNSPFKNLKLLK